MDRQVIATHGGRVRPMVALLAAAAVTTLLGVGFPATLPAAELRQERVRVSDLDLTTAQGHRQLQRRLTAAIERVCAPPGTVLESNVRVRLAVSACRRNARAGVREQLAASSALAKLQLVSSH